MLIQAPLLEIEAIEGEGEFDFGDISPNTTVTHTFKLFNPNNASLEIANVRSSCQCTTAGDVIGSIVGPKSTIAIPITMKAGTEHARRVGDLKVYYRTSGESFPRIKLLQVFATVQTDYWVSPVRIDFGLVTATKPVTRTIQFHPQSSGIRITGILSTQKSITADVAPRSSDEKETIQVTFNPAKAMSAVRDSVPITIKTNSQSVPEIILYATYQTDRAFTIAPGAVVVGANQSGDVSTEIVLSSNRLFTISLDGTLPPQIRVSDPGVGFAQEHRLKTTFGDTGGHGLNEKLRVYVRFQDETPGDGEPSVVEIPFHRLPTR
jgi:hypothetical protein